ncbi:hypothetical protein ABIA43_005033 [Bradyrhizobium sp. USDA 328]
MVWDPQQYLKFSGHRLRPAVDLLMRIPDFAPRAIADLGAGAGNVTKLIRGALAGCARDRCRGLGRDGRRGAEGGARRGMVA